MLPCGINDKMVYWEMIRGLVREGAMRGELAFKICRRSTCKCFVLGTNFFKGVKEISALEEGISF